MFNVFLTVFKIKKRLTVTIIATINIRIIFFRANLPLVHVHVYVTFPHSICFSVDVQNDMTYVLRNWISNRADVYF